MKFTSDIFNVEITEIDDDNFIHIIHIKKIENELEELIEKHIVSICDSDEDESIQIVKEELKLFLQNKTKETKMGAVAEFIIHLYLKDIGFNQECLFLNLEEGSIKKGFDGYYTYSAAEWIMESKSGSIQTDAISHKKKIKEAYKDLKSKIGGDAANNPWKNAFNHAKVVGTELDVLNNIELGI